ncbi:MAG: ABC transporter transmembrane domain-containing protein [Flavobacteriales bacterium]|tara:strand:- start:3506 stop:5317 length:1812 start_codon:yes stop_codon:yes gene_type:complete
MARPERIKLEKGTFKKAATFFRFIKPYKATFILGMIFLFLSSVTAMLFPYLMGQLIGKEKPVDIAGVETIIPDASQWIDMNNTSTLIIVMMCVFGAQAIFSFFRIYLFGYFTANALKDLRLEAFSQLVSSPLNFFNKNKVGELTSRISSDVEMLRDTLNSTLATFIRQIITVIISLIALFFMSPRLCFIMLGVVPVVAIIAVFFGKFIKKIAKETQDSSAQSNSVLEESLMGINNVKAFANEFFEIIRYKKRVIEVRDKTMRIVKWRGLFTTFVIFFMFGSIVFVIWQGKLMVDTGDMSNENFFSFILYTIFVGGAISNLPDLYAKVQKAVGSTESLMTILDGETEDLSLKPIEKPLNLKGKVNFNNVSFSYETRDDVEVLKGISMDVKAGQQIALVGPSGSGKSTLSALLLQFYKPISGSILFDDKNANEYFLSELRNEMAIVPQEVILFGGTIKENIAYGNLNASEEEIIEAAKGANAHGFISEFPEGYETYVGDRGIQLSGGQKQRVAIARAILKNPSILILDEATSSLDSESELLVQEALDRLMKGRTSFVIAHRLSTIKNCDKILVLESGNIVESGTHEELVKLENGVYRNLSEIQYR